MGPDFGGPDFGGPGFGGWDSFDTVFTLVSIVTVLGVLIVFGSIIWA